MLEKLEENSARRLDHLMLSEKPLGIRFLNWILGPSKPSIYTKITFFVALLFWFIFILWNIISLISLGLGDLIFDNKSVDIAALIQQRGNELGFEPTQFLDRLLLYHTGAIACWSVVGIGLILLWRSSRFAPLLFIGGCLAYLINMLAILGYNYYLWDTTNFDKITYWLLLLQTVTYFLIQKKKTDEERA